MTNVHQCKWKLDSRLHPQKDHNTVGGIISADDVVTIHDSIRFSTVYEAWTLRYRSGMLRGVDRVQVTNDSKCRSADRHCFTWLSRL